MSDTSYELWCLVQGDDTLSPIVTPRTTSIGVLKQHIKRARENSLFHKVDASPRSLAGALLLVICSDVMSDTFLPVGRCERWWDIQRNTGWQICDLEEIFRCVALAAFGCPTPRLCHSAG